MKIDFADAFASGVASAFLSLLVFLGGIWTGVTTGAIALGAADLAGDGNLDATDLNDFFANPQVAILSWILPGVVFIAAALFRFGRIDGSGAIRWGILVAAVSGLLVWANAEEIDSGWVPLAVAWTAWTLLIGMIGTGLWFLRYWQINRWAGEMAMLKAENAARRSELELEAEGLQDDGPSR
jgi:hypothetical protein